VRLMDQADIANRAVALANLRLGWHDKKTSVERKKQKSQPADDLLWRHAVEFLRMNRRLSYRELAHKIIEKYPADANPDYKPADPDWLRRKLSTMLNRPAKG